MAAQQISKTQTSPQTSKKDSASKDNWMKMNERGYTPLHCVIA